MRNWRHLLKSTLVGLVLLGLGGLSVGAIATKFSDGALLSVQSGSMVPVLNKGDLVGVERVSANEIRVGDIITFTNRANRQQTITHRVLERPSADNGWKFITKGDANAVVDTPVEPRSIVGRQSYSIPKLGYLSDALRNPIGLLIIIYVPALWIMYGELRRLIDYYKSQEKYILSWRRRAQERHQKRFKHLAKALPLLVLVPMFVVIPAYALHGGATLTANTISATREVTPPPPSNVCPAGTNGTTIIINGSGSVNISNSNNQNAQSGNASSTGGGSATSGNATNCNSTNINVNADNN